MQNSLVQPDGEQYTALGAERELLADFMDDSLSDRDFLALLAKRNPDKFQQFALAVNRVSAIGYKLKGL